MAQTPNCWNQIIVKPDTINIMFDLFHGLRLGMPVASLGEDVVLPMLAILTVFGIPIVAILTNHQRRMAEIIHRNHVSQQVDPMVQQQLAHMQSQIADMKSMMQEHIINNDRSFVPPAPTSVEQRLSQ